MAKKKDINDVTDDIAMIMREVVEATENNMLAEIAMSLNINLNGIISPKDYLLKQAAKNKELQKKLLAMGKQAQQQQLNIAKNIGTYAGINVSPLEDEIKKGASLLVQAAQKQQQQQVQKIYQLNKYNTSAQFIPDLKKSIIEQTKLGIDQGLPVTFKDGRKVGYREYMEMAVRTGIQQEIGNQQIEIAKDANIVFFLCDEYADCADDHADYQGKIYYNEAYETFNLTEDAKAMIANAIRVKGYLGVQEVREGKPYLTTRPNCRHRLIPISIDDAIADTVESVKQKNDAIRGNYRPENYDALKQQRAYERNIRRAKAKLETLELIKSKTKTNDYDGEISKIRSAINRQQGGLRKLLADFPSLSRERRRETRKILIKDLGVKYNLKLDPSLPPTPVTNTPPPAPAAPLVPKNEVIIEHFKMPEEKQEYVKTETFTVVKGKNLTRQLFKGKVKEDKKIAQENSKDIKPLLKEQNFNGKPRVVGEVEFREVLKKTPYMLIRTYADMGDKKTQKYRNDMLEGDFFVDNTGGAMYGRGMYFYRFDGDRFDLNKMYDTKVPDILDPDFKYGQDQISGLQQRKLMAVSDIVRYSMNSLVKSDDTKAIKDLEDRTFMLKTAVGQYNSKMKLDVVAVDPSAKIGKIDKIETEWATDYLDNLPPEEQNEVTEIFKTWYKEKAIKDAHKEKYNQALEEKSRYINEKAKVFFNDPNSSVRDTYNLDRLPNGKILQQQLYDDPELTKLNDKISDLGINEPPQTYKSYWQMENKAREAAAKAKNNDLFNDLDEVLKGTDTGVKAAALGYDGYAVDYKEYMVIINRSALVILDDDGKWNKGSNTRFDLSLGAADQFLDQFAYDEEDEKSIKRQLRTLREKSDAVKDEEEK